LAERLREVLRRLADLVRDLFVGVLDLLLEDLRDLDRDFERDLDALGVLDRRFAEREREDLEARRRETDRDLDTLASLDLGALGVRALRRLTDLLLLALEVDREVLLLDALGALLLRLTALRLRERFLGSLGDLALLRRRETDRLLLALGVRLRRADLLFCFFLEGDLGSPLAFVGVRARFLIPISLLRFSSISFLYASRACTWFW